MDFRRRDYRLYQLKGLLQANAYTLALPLANSLQQNYPTYPDTLLHLAHIHAQLGNLPAAQNLLQQTIALAPTFAAAKTLAMVVEHHLYHYGQARSYLQQSGTTTTIGKQTVAQTLIGQHSHLAWLYLQVGRFAEAHHQLIQARSLAPTYPDLMLAEAYVLAHTQRLEPAYQLLSRLEQTHPHYLAQTGAKNYWPAIPMPGGLLYGAKLAANDR